MSDLVRTQIVGFHTHRLSSFRSAISATDTSCIPLCFFGHNLSRHVGKPTICICKNKGADQLTAKLISAFVFATRIVQFLFYLNPKFQASSSFLCLYRPVCVGPVRKPHCWFSHEVAHSLTEKLNVIGWLVDWGLTSHQQQRSYGDGTSVYSPIRQTGDRTCDPWFTRRVT